MFWIQIRGFVAFKVTFKCPVVLFCGLKSDLELEVNSNMIQIVEMLISYKCNISVVCRNIKWQHEDDDDYLLTEWFYLNMNDLMKSFKWSNIHEDYLKHV